MKIAGIAMLVAVSLSSAQQGAKTFAGTVSDDICVKGDHSHMRMGANDAECVTACVDAHGAGYVLFDGKNVYKLSSREPLAPFAARTVKVVGRLDAKTRTILVESIS